MDKIYNKIYKDIPSYDRFLKVDEIDKLVNIIASFSNVKKKIIGNTLENEDLISIEIGDADKTALIIGVPHSDEPLGSLVVTFFSRWLALNDKINNFNWRWIFIPILERRGMRLNEGWFNLPGSFSALGERLRPGGRARKVPNFLVPPELVSNPHRKVLSPRRSD